MKEQDITWDYVEGLLRQMVANENWNVVTAEDAQEQLNRRLKFIEGIKYEFNKLPPTPPTQEKVEVLTREDRHPCLKANGNLICYCGKCKSEDYPLPADFSTLKDLVDDSVTEITIETPDGWKCNRKGCTTDFLHSHGTYPCLKPTQDTESWMEEFKSLWLFLRTHLPGLGIGDATPAILDFIEHKKQEWEDTSFREGSSIMKSEMEIDIKQARTQGAEAAVDYIMNNDNLNWFKNMETHSEYEKLLYKAKEV